MGISVIVDCNSICHRVRHTLGGLSHDEQSCGVIFGFLRQLQTISKRLNTNKFLFCWDTRSSKRIELYPNYKANRHKVLSPEDQELNDIAYAQFNLLKDEILPKIGFKNIFYAKGYESDDIIAGLVNDNDLKFVIVSTDGDLYQLLQEGVSMLISNDKPLFTEDLFVQKYNISPEKWAMVKAIAGCSTDNIAGVVGVGEKTAIKFLKNELPITSKTYKAIIAWKDNVPLNLELVKLPFKGLRSFTIKSDKLSINGFLEVCNEYGFYSLSSKDSLEFWRRNFFE